MAVKHKEAIQRILARAGDARASYEEFVYHLKVKSKHPCKESTVYNYLSRLDGFLTWTRDCHKTFEDWSAELAYKYASRLDNPRSRTQLLFAIKRFFVASNHPDKDRLEVPTAPEAKLPDPLLEDEVLRMAKACDNNRDEALILVTYESSRRLHEIQGLKIRDVKFDDFGALATFHSKKSEDATIRLTLSVSALQRVISHHRHRENLDAPVFYGYNGEISATRFRQVLRAAAKRGKVERRVWPHLLRHSRIAEFKRRKKKYGMSEDDIMNVTGHKDPRMLRRYGKITMADTNEKLLEAAGLKEVEEKEKNGIRKCPRCGYVNGPLDKYCSQCTLPLSAKEINEEDKLLSRIKTLFPIVGAFDFFKDVTDNAYKRLDEIAEQTAKRLKG